MATDNQRSYIEDLAVLKTKEFKEVKELLVSTGIVADSASTVSEAQSLAEITHALTDKQASSFIDALIASKAPVRSRVYSPKRVEQTISALGSIKDTIAGWDFN